MSYSFSRLFGTKSSLKFEHLGIAGSTVLSGESVFARSFSNCNRTAITRVHRLQYLRQYPTVVVNPDGSTFTIRYHEPRQIIKLPVDVNLLSESARNARLERRKPRTRVTSEEDFEDEGFDAKKYLKFVKK